VKRNFSRVKILPSAEGMSFRQDYSDVTFGVRLKL
jgi:hypothetical protein